MGGKGGGHEWQERLALVDQDVRARAGGAMRKRSRRKIRLLEVDAILPPDSTHRPRSTLESWVPFSEQFVETVVEHGAANLQQQIGAVRRPANGLSPAHALFHQMAYSGFRRRG